MSDQQPSHRDQRHHHHDQHHRQQSQDRQPSGHPEAQRREFLWRERVKLELQVQALLARAESLDQAWRALEQRKANMQHQKPKLAAQIVLSGLARARSLPAERLFHYERERILQEEERLRQAMIFCQGDLAALQAQIEVIQLELSFLQ
jgi:seryl-tRNA synthetase